jgi:hypothetical protein
MEASEDTGARHREGFTPAGDPVCWLEHVCDECGALVEGALPATCWRCGAPVVPR